MTNNKQLSPMQYGIIGSIITIVIAGVLFGMVWAFNNIPNTNFHTNVCSDMYVLHKDNTVSDYPPLVELANKAANETHGVLISYRTNGKWLGCGGKDCGSIYCSYPVRVCEGYVDTSGICMNLELNLVVNYSDWKEWKSTEGTK